MSLEHNPARCDRGAYSIARLCEAHDLARATLYKLWKLGLGPRYFKAGNRVLIGVEAASEWRLTMEQLTAKRDKAAYPQDKAPLPVSRRRARAAEEASHTVEEG